MRATRSFPTRPSNHGVFRLLAQLGPVALLALPSFVAPCGVSELPFEEAVRRTLVQAGYINSYDVVSPVVLQLALPRCGSAAPVHAKDVCSCVGQRDRADFIARAGA